MTEKGRGGGDLVETFELHEITSLPYLRAPRSSERAGTYSPGCPAALSAPWSARVPGPIRGVIDWGLVNLFIYLGIFCNFNIIFNSLTNPYGRISPSTFF
jgi:hypothetical protein